MTQWHRMADRPLHPSDIGKVIAGLDARGGQFVGIVCRGEDGLHVSDTGPARDLKLAAWEIVLYTLLDPPVAWPELRQPP